MSKLPVVPFAFQKEGLQMTLQDFTHPALDEITEGPNFSLSMHAAPREGNGIVCVRKRIGLVLFHIKC